MAVEDGPRLSGCCVSLESMLHLPRHRRSLESCLRPGTSVTPGYRGCFSAFPDDTTDCDLSDCWRGEPPLPYSAHCAVRQFASDYLVRLAAHLTKRNKCTVQVIACPLEALIPVSYTHLPSPRDGLL